VAVKKVKGFSVNQVTTSSYNFKIKQFLGKERGNSNNGRAKSRKHCPVYWNLHE
jgi:hypothetical protein